MLKNSSIQWRSGIRRHLKGVAQGLWSPPDYLTRLANKYGSDKGDRCHYYTRIYHHLFQHLRSREITLLEIGLRHPLDSRRSVAPSLSMWRDYFPHAQLIGFDIQEFAEISIYNCTIIQGDMSSRKDLSKLSDYGPFDIVIDDGSHVSTHQQVALASLFPYVVGGGFYIIEDLNWQPQGTEIASVPKTKELLRSRSFCSPAITSSETSFLVDNVRSIELFDDAADSPKNDALGVIVKL
jgi:hypothetical protein